MQELRSENGVGDFGIVMWIGMRIMISSEYIRLAFECVREADATDDAERKKTLLDMAKLYNQTALRMETGDAPSADPVPSTL